MEKRKKGQPISFISRTELDRRLKKAEEKAQKRQRKRERKAKYDK